MIDNETVDICECCGEPTLTPRESALYTLAQLYGELAESGYVGTLREFFADIGSMERGFHENLQALIARAESHAEKHH
jgi:hypothetical protein